MNEACDHDVSNPRLCGDVMVYPNDKVAVGSGMELVDICKCTNVHVHVHV